MNHRFSFKCEFDNGTKMEGEVPGKNFFCANKKLLSILPKDEGHITSMKIIMNKRKRRSKS